MTRTTGFIKAMAFGAIALGLLAGPMIPPAEAAGDEIRAMKLISRPQSNNPQAFQAAQLIAQEWRKLGLDVQVQAMPRPQQSDVVWYKREGWDMTMWQMVGRPERSDPDEIVFNLFHSSTAPKGYNFIGYINPEFDKVAEAQRVETDKEKRRELVFKAQEILDRDQPNVFLVYPLRTFPFDKTVWNEETIVEQPGLGIKNFWTFIEAEPLGDQKDLIINGIEPLNAINPLYISGATDSWVTELIWDRLLRIDRTGLPEPWAAESYNWIDKTTIDVTIRAGMKWHDGKPVTAEDVKFSFEAPNMGDEAPMYKPFVKNIDSVTVTGPLTVRFKLKTPQAAFLTSSLSKINLAPKHIWEPIIKDLMDKPENAEAYQEDTPIGSGPFKYVRWKQQEEVVLEANPEHWSPPKMERWILRIVTNVEATVGMLRSGELNFLGEYNGDPKVIADIAKKDGDLAIVQTPDVGFQYATFNQRVPPFNDANFRRALSTAINRQLMVAAAWNGAAVPANSPVSVALEYWHNPKTDNMKTGLDLAKQILEDAGYTWVKGKLHYPDGVKETVKR